MRHSVVSLHRWPALDGVDSVLAQCLHDLGGMAAFVSPGQTVVIKPNLTANAPEDSGGTTHVALVEALVRQVQACSPGRVVVAEGTGMFGLEHETAFPRPAWREMAARTGVELYNLDAGPHTTLRVPGGRFTGELPIASLLLQADVLITVPCLKTHITTDYTVALKNAYAHVPQTTRTEVHRQYRVEHALVDINHLRPPDLVVVDAYDGAEGIAGGIKFDRPAGARLMMAGADPVAVDIVARQLMGMTCRTRYLEWAAADGLGTDCADEIEVRGEPVHALARRFQTAGEEMCQVLPGLQILDQGACSGCRVAALSAIQRYLDQGIAQPFALVFGGGDELPALDRPTLVVGNCAAKHAHLGAYIAGCPAPSDAVRETMEAQDLVCLKCRRLAEGLLGRIPPALAPHLRVVAAGAQVHLGERVPSAGWHVELLVGDCSAAYVERVIERASQFGMDADRDIVHLRGCPVCEDQVLEALGRLEQTVAVHHA
ncbi:MAG: DUF362 domain-containing protein [Anaerolineae bacterium]|jgi:uncharacterized protein (DUF362 family)